MKAKTTKSLMKATQKLAEAQAALSELDTAAWQEIEKGRPELMAVLPLLKHDMQFGIMRCAQIINLILWPRRTA
jgi:hypothetical protein